MSSLPTWCALLRWAANEIHSCNCSGPGRATGLRPVPYGIFIRASGRPCCFLSKIGLLVCTVSIHSFWCWQVLTSAWEPKLIDCGLSKLIDPEAVRASAVSSSGGAFGTPGYQCPVYQQTRTYDWSSEMFSFGVVLLEILTGKLATAAGCQNMGAHFAESDDPEDPVSDTSEQLPPVGHSEQLKSEQLTSRSKRLQNGHFASQVTDRVAAELLGLLPGSSPQVLPWPLSVALDTAWGRCPEDIRNALCKLALDCVKGRVRNAAHRRPRIDAAMQALLQLDRSSRSAADVADAERLRAENADLMQQMAALSVERERGLRLYTCVSCTGEFPLKAGLLCAGGGASGERHFLCGAAFGNGCADGHVAARCGGRDPPRSAPELVHVGDDGSRVLGVQCCVGGGGCALFDQQTLLPALMPATCELLQATLFELERDAARVQAERAAKEAAEREVRERLAEQAAAYEAQLTELKSALAARDEAERREAERRQAELERQQRALEEERRRAEAASEEWIRINTRPCPNCGRRVQRIEGCTDLVCGRDYHGTGRGPNGELLGCGFQFKWTGLGLDGKPAPYTRATF